MTIFYCEHRSMLSRMWLNSPISSKKNVVKIEKARMIVLDEKLSDRWQMQSIHFTDVIPIGVLLKFTFGSNFHTHDIAVFTFALVTLTCTSTYLTTFLHSICILKYCLPIPWLSFPISLFLSLSNTSTETLSSTSTFHHPMISRNSAFINHR